MENEETSDSKFEFKTDTYIETLNSPISCKEVRKGLKSLKNNKSGCLDLILNEFLKYGANSLILPLVKLFNNSFESDIFPYIWNISTISTLHKSGSFYDCNNYRGISIGSYLGELLTKILQYRISNYLEENNFIEGKQAGFRHDSNIYFENTVK
ncbi:unnamed protein product [Mytilus coruscus]|uniref:Reverse transcriptase domain-containing protein n=1 Tax=Mytilus coruscus TaxID=42192 RepID=A0A6J8DI77_MYTCO|nr:unnamed protein product [Mytilus coruscus]